ncbi:MAG: hypothetical protein QXY76_07870 [Nitrososphaeria archaeon]
MLSGMLTENTKISIEPTPEPTMIPYEHQTINASEQVVNASENLDLDLDPNVYVVDLSYNFTVEYWDESIPYVMPSTLFAKVSGYVSNYGNGTARNVNVTVHFYYLARWKIGGFNDCYNVTISLYSIEPMSTAYVYREYMPLLSLEGYGLYAQHYKITVEHE